MGDSISAGFAMMGGVPLEFRGWTAATGSRGLTLPAIFEHVNGGRPLRGTASLVTDPLEDGVISHDRSRRPNNPALCKLNAAQSNARARHLPAQVDYLRSEVAREGLEGQWKLLHVLIGANDILGESCSQISLEAVGDDYERHLNASLAELQETVPRLLVSVAELFDAPAVVRPYAEATIVCREMHKKFHEGDCGGHQPRRSAAVTDEINSRIRRVADFWNALQLPDFAVAVQPFTRNLHAPDLSYLSKLDCFHPSRRANEEIAVGLWNSLLSPPQDKPQGPAFLPPEDLRCPGPDDLLYVG